MINTVRKILDKILEWSLVLIMLVMVLNVLWQVFTRFILQNPSSITEEFARYGLIWLGVLGASYAAGKKMHLAIDILPMKLTGKARVYLEIFIQFSIGCFALFVMVIGGMNLVRVTLHLEQISAAMRIQLGYVYTVIPISGILILMYVIVFLIEQVGQLSSRNLSESGA